VLNLNQLAQFLSIVRAGSLSAATDELGITSAALSKSLAALERQLEVRLFDRVGRGLQLTAVGAEFAEQVTELLGHAHTVYKQIQTSAEGTVGRLRIGSGPAALQGPLTEVVNLIVAANPGITLEIETGRTADLLRGLRQFRYDFLVTDIGDTPANLDHYRLHPLPAERIVLVCSRKHPLASRRKVLMSEALEYPWVTPHVPTLMRKRVAEVLRAEDAPARAFMRLAAIPDVRIEDLNSCMQIASGGECLAATLESKIHSSGFPASLKLLPAKLNITTNVAVIRLKNRTPSPLASRTIDVLAEAGGRSRSGRERSRR
jgi:DNA-binding transcriptional LysR family regulator